MVVHELLAETQPEYRERRLAAEEQTRESIDSGEALRVARSARSGSRSLSTSFTARPRRTSRTAQVKSQIAVLNRDFRAKNPDKRKVPAGLEEPGRSDANIEFALATKDPKGKQTTGSPAPRLPWPLRPRQHGEGAAHGRRGRLAGRPLSERLGLQPRRTACWATRSSRAVRAKTDGVVILYSAFGSRAR